MSSGICYHACLVQNGVIDYITPVTTRRNALEHVKSWKAYSSQYAESFMYKVIPAKWKKQIEDYLNCYENEHKSNVDSSNVELPF